MKIVTLYFILITTIFAIRLTEGNYSVMENTVKGKRWKTRVELKIKNNEIVWVNIDMVTKGGKLRSQDEKYLKKVLEDTDGINPYIELPKEYMKKLEKIENYKMSRVDTIAGATVISNKFNKMTMFLIKKSEDGKTGEFKGWFH